MIFSDWLNINEARCRTCVFMVSCVFGSVRDLNVSSGTQMFVSCTQWVYTDSDQQHRNVWLQQTIKLQHKASLTLSGQLHEWAADGHWGLCFVPTQQHNICLRCFCLCDVAHGLLCSSVTVNTSLISKQLWQQSGHGPEELVTSAELIMDELDVGEDDGKGEEEDFTFVLISLKFFFVSIKQQPAGLTHEATQKYFSPVTRLRCEHVLMKRFYDISYSFKIKRLD